MQSEQPYYDDDESDFSNDADGFEFDDTDDDAVADESSEDGQQVEASPADIIDLIANEKAAEAKQHIYQALYSKVGERLDAMKAETRQSAFPTEQ
jgi:hypothetical protein